MTAGVSIDRLVGIDVGGTKTHLAAIDDRRERRDVVRPSSEWRRGHLFSDERNLPALADWIRSYTRLGATSAVAIGLRDCDTETDIERARAAISRALNLPVRVENDADLLGPAAGHEHAIAMIVGTGSVVSARGVAGRRITAGGHGWLFGDWGSGPALVRDAITRVLTVVDSEPGLGREPLVHELLEHFAVDNPAELAAAATISAEPSTWGSASARIFAAAHLGSSLATKTIDFAARQLGDGVAAVVRMGGLGDEVVAAGGVIMNQPLLREAVRARLKLLARPLQLQLLAVAPVEGALRLAEAGIASQETTHRR
jgi:N-acetylglucosamine kinase-like BadF-type ATPase